MKIGIDCRLWDESGVGRYIRNLVKGLLVLDVSNEYILFSLDKDVQNLKSQISNLKSKKWKIVNANIRWHTLKEQIELPKILNKENLDLMHFPYFSVPVFYKGPYVVTIHDVIINHFSTGVATTLPLPIYRLKILGYKFVISQAARRAKKIIVPLYSTKKEVAKTLNIKVEKIVVTYEGADDFVGNSKFEIRNSKLKNLSTDKFFLYVGNAYPHKNLENLIAGFKILAAQQSQVKLILVGKEDFFYKRLKKYVRDLDLVDKIVFYGEASDSELSWFYKNTIALVNSSLMEGFGLPIVEAMSLSCLVLASDIASTREVARSAAIYFDPKDISQIHSVLNHALDLKGEEKSRKTFMGLRYSKGFSWAEMAKKTLQIYESSTTNGSV